MLKKPDNHAVFEMFMVKKIRKFHCKNVQNFKSFSKILQNSCCDTQATLFAKTAPKCAFVCQPYKQEPSGRPRVLPRGGTVAAKKTTARKAPAKRKVAKKKAVAKAPAKKAAKRKPAAKKAAKKAPAKKKAAKKAPAKKKAAKKAPAKRKAAKKAPAKRKAAKKAPAKRKAAAKRKPAAKKK